MDGEEEGGEWSDRHERQRPSSCLEFDFPESRVMDGEERREGARETEAHRERLSKGYGVSEASSVKRKKSDNELRGASQV